MHTIKLLLTYYLNISVEAANLSDCRIESNRIETFLPELECSSPQSFVDKWSEMFNNLSLCPSLVPVSFVEENEYSGFWILLLFS